jgi:hypothetical protein
MALGDITGVIDTFGAPDSGPGIAIIRVADGVCAVVHVGSYLGSGVYNNYMRSIGVDNNGNINAVISTCSYCSGIGDMDSYYIQFMRPHHISGDVFAMAYTAGGFRLRTCNVMSDGSVVCNIGNTILELNSPLQVRGCMTHISGVVYAFATNYGRLGTVGIQTDGTITGVIDTFTVDTTVLAPYVVRITDTVCAIAYEGPSSHGWLKTVGIQADGTITGTIGSFEFDTSSAAEPNIIHIAGDVYAITYRGPSGHGWVKTVGIQADGTITGTIGSFEFDTSTAVHLPDMLRICDGVYAIAYEGPSGYGWLKTVGIQDDGTITGTIGSLEHTALVGNTYGNNIIHINGDTYAIASSLNRVTTVGIVSPVAATAPCRFTGGLTHRPIH